MAGFFWLSESADFGVPVVKNRSPSLSRELEKASASRNGFGRTFVWQRKSTQHSKTSEKTSAAPTKRFFPRSKRCRVAKGVEFVTIDLSEGYRSAVKEAFPQAQIVADRFHVLRCIDDRMKEELRRLPADIRKRDKTKERLLFRKLSALSSRSQEALTTWLLAYPALAQLHSAKQEMLRAFGRKGSPLKRRDMFSSLMDKMAKSTHAAVRSLRQTYFSWRNEIGNAMLTKWLNGRTEGFNVSPPGDPCDSVPV